MTKILHDKFLLVAGTGELPRLVLDLAAKSGATACILGLPGFDRSGMAGHRQIPVDLDIFEEVIAGLAAEGYRQVIPAGGVRRHQVADGSRPEIWDGDDTVIRMLVERIEGLGLEIIGVHQLLPGLLASPGILTVIQPADSDRADLCRARDIVERLGQADIGQAAVVASRLCLAVETVTGTDVMLQQAGMALAAEFPDRKGRLGLAYKAAKPGQELRVDFPVVGPGTIRRAADAGLGGIALDASGVMLLQRERAIAIADQEGMFIWSVERDPD